MVDPHGAMRNGQATFVRYRDGHYDVISWANGPALPADVQFARQNLPLIVQEGIYRKVVDALVPAAVGHFGHPSRGSGGTTHHFLGGVYDIFGQLCKGVVA